METLSIVISVLCGIFTWYYATKKKRLLKAIKEEEEKIEKIKKYSSSTGYKDILRDCFHVFSYATSLCLIMTGFKILIPLFINTVWLDNLLSYITASIYIASGVLFFELFLSLSKTFKPENTIQRHARKQSKLEQEVDEI